MCPLRTFAVFCTDIANNRISTEIGYRLPTLKVLQGVTWTKNYWIGHALPYLCTRRTEKEENRERMYKRLPIKNALAFPSTSRCFPAVPCCFEIWQTHHTFVGINVQWNAEQAKVLSIPIRQNYKQNNNKTMGYFIITDSNWAKLRYEILNLAETCHKAFGEQSRHPEWLHNGDVCRLLNISKRTLQHYRDTGVLPFSQIGHKCYYKREDVERLLQTKTEKSKTEK